MSTGTHNRRNIFFADALNQTNITRIIKFYHFCDGSIFSVNTYNFIIGIPFIAGK